MADIKISALTASTTPLAGTEVLPIVQSSTTKQVSVANLTAGRDVSVLNLLGTQTVGTSLGSGGLYLSGDGGPDTAYAGYNYKNINGTETVPVTTRASWRHGFANGGTVAWLVSYRAANAAASAWTNMFRVESTGNAIIDNGNLVQGTAAKGVNFTANTPAAGMTSRLLNWYEEGTWTPTDTSVAGLTFTGVSGQYVRNGSLVQCAFALTFPSTVSGANVSIGGLPFISNASNTGWGGYQTYTDYTTAQIAFLNTASATTFTMWRNGSTIITNATLSGKTVRGVIIYRV